MAKTSERTTKKTKSDTVKKSSKPSRVDRDVFSLHNGVRKKELFKKVDTSEPKQRKYDSDEDEQMTEIRKITAQTLKAKRQLLTVKNVKRQERVSYETLIAGTVVGCRVTHVFTDRIMVSLPYRMHGYIPLTHISAQYTKLMHQVAEGQSTTETPMTLHQLYTPGQWLMAAVANTPLNTKPKRGLMLSVYPSDVNSNTVGSKMVKVGIVLQCSVVSVEDHGYSVDCGVRGIVAAFLPAKDLPQGKDVGVGSVLQCVVSLVGGSHDAVNITMSADTEKVNAAANKVADKNIGFVLPGMSVQGIVTVSANTGLTIHIGSEEEYYELLESGSQNIQWNIGIISRYHLRSTFDQCHFFRTGQKVVAKVLFATNFPKSVYLSVNKMAFVNDSKTTFHHSNGIELNKIKEGTVFDCSDEGVLIKLGANNAGFCFANHAKKNNVDKVSVAELKEQYPAGKQVSCKPVAYNAVDNLFIVLLNVTGETSTEQAAESIKTGAVLTVTIKEHLEIGAHVTTKTGIPGFVRRVHLTDSSDVEPEEKYPVGTHVKARVLGLSENANGMIRSKVVVQFTLRPKLVKSSFPIISEYSEESAGQHVLGLVKMANDRKVDLELGHGIVAVFSSKSADVRMKFPELYEIGQLVPVSLTRLNPATDKFPPIYMAKTQDKKTEVKSTVQPWFLKLKDSLAASERSPKKSIVRKRAVSSDIKKSKKIKKSVH